MQKSASLTCESRIQVESNPRSHGSHSVISSTFTALSVAVGLSVAVLSAHVSLHVGYVVVFWYLTVFLQIGALVLRHSGDEIFNDFIGDEGMTEVELGNVGLTMC